MDDKLTRSDPPPRHDQETYTFTKDELIAAYERWIASAAKTADGRHYLDNKVADAETQALTLIGFLTR